MFKHQMTTPALAVKHNTAEIIHKKCLIYGESFFIEIAGRSKYLRKKNNKIRITQISSLTRSHSQSSSLLIIERLPNELFFCFEYMASFQPKFQYTQFQCLKQRRANDFHNSNPEFLFDHQEKIKELMQKKIFCRSYAELFTLRELVQD